MQYEIHRGDCIAAMRAMPDNSVDSIVTDPPYELSNDGKQSAARVFTEFAFPKNPQIKAHSAGGDCLALLVGEILSLGSVRLDPTPAPAVPVIAVALDDDSALGQQQVENAAECAVGVAGVSAGCDVEAEDAKHIGSFALELADPADALQVLGEIGAGFISGGIGVGFAAGAARVPSLLHGLRSVVAIDDHVGALDHALSDLVGANGRAGGHMFGFNLAGGSVEQFSAAGALLFSAILKASGAKLVRASAPASGLPAMLEARRVRVVGDAADRAFTFDLIVHPQSVTSMGFMGKEWDGSKIAYNVEMWAEALRVLKPGGHLLAFSGSRTYHRMAVAIEDAGFEVRDQIMWVYGSGFPKSHDVSAAIDKAAGATRTEVVRTRTNGIASGASTFGDDNWKGKDLKVVEIKAPATDAARQWEGWGTALKPAHEPICVARKPLIGTVAANVLAHGTGALNIDGCRVATDDKLGGGMVSKGRPKVGEGWDRPWMHDPEVTERKKAESAAKVAAAEALGRWPANLIHDGSDEVLALFPESSTTGKRSATSKAATVEGTAWLADNHQSTEYTDSGSAARFFYQPKCAKPDRNSGLDGLMCVILEWNDSTTGEIKWGVEARQVKLMVDTEQYPPKVIAAFGAGSKNVTEWNTMLYGKTTTEQSPKGSTFTTETKTNLTTPLAILNYFQNCITSESIPGANCETVSGGSPADSAASCSTLIATTCEKTAFLLGVNHAASPLRLKLNVSAAASGHPTVKPTDLMAYLVRLVTPPGGLVLDPFTGSGSTGKAAIREGFRFVGCELSDEYAWLADRRIEAELVGDLL